MSKPKAHTHLFSATSHSLNSEGCPPLFPALSSAPPPITRRLYTSKPLAAATAASAIGNKKRHKSFPVLKSQTREAMRACQHGICTPRREKLLSRRPERRAERAHCREAKRKRNSFPQKDSHFVRTAESSRRRFSKIGATKRARPWTLL